MKTRLYLSILISAFSVLSLTLISPARADSYTHYQEPEWLTFDELKTLSADPEPKGELKKKLNKLWVTPIISNEAYDNGGTASPLFDPKLGKFMRVASWNIEKSMAIDEAVTLFTSEPEGFEKMLSSDVKEDQDLYKQILSQRQRLMNAGILILEEMEIGIKRSKYKNAAAELAKALGMNYAYGTQYLEIDPVTLGLDTLEFEKDDPEEIREDIRDYYSVDPALYKGVFGSAVLSKYPIKYVELKPLKTKPYDWYWDEQKKMGATEAARRIGAKVLFKNAIQRELKVGNRNYFRVDLDVPELPGGTLTVINIHLEIKCEPYGREAQMHEILSYIKEIKNPVIVMGDFNMSSTDISPTTAARVLKRTAKNPGTWLSIGVNAVAPQALVINTTRAVSNVTKNFNDPTAKHIPIVAPNPLRSFFDMVKDFRFEDGKSFDFRGNPNRSVGNKDKPLANSNQRGTKGFRTSFRVVRPLGLVGKYRLDWVFVKAFALTPEDKSEPYRFAPHFGETLEEMAFALEPPISDHAPNVVDLPFEEPSLK
ncbi:MAG: hypothetical protein H6757_03330 [Candidatus Omnitrophica bacterium]|nr:hypothetical protein [Candidatus Omnitrophota bacterium]